MLQSYKDKDAVKIYYELDNINEVITTFILSIASESLCQMACFWLIRLLMLKLVMDGLSLVLSYPTPSNSVQPKTQSIEDGCGLILARFLRKQIFLKTTLFLFGDINSIIYLISHYWIHMALILSRRRDWFDNLAECFISLP